MDQTGINSAEFPPPVCPLEILSSPPDRPIEMETQQPAFVQIDDWHIPDFTYEADEELVTGDTAQIRLDSPPSTIPFDEDSPPQQLPSERVPSGEEVGEAAGSPSAVIEISDGEENHDTRPRRRRRGRPDYAYRDYQDTMEHAISAPPIGKRKREDSDVDFRSKMVSRSYLFLKPG
jgi:hypothetical protein